MDSHSRLRNSNTTLKGVTQMTPSAVRLVENQDVQSATQLDTEAAHVRCTPSFAHNAAKTPKCLSVPEVIGPYTAATATIKFVKVAAAADPIS